MKRHFGQRLRQLRQARGLTQEALAEALEVHVRTVRNLEAGVHGPGFDNLERLAEVLEVEVKVLFSFGEGENGSASEESG